MVLTTSDLQLNLWWFFYLNIHYFKVSSKESIVHCRTKADHIIHDSPTPSPLPLCHCATVSVDHVTGQGIARRDSDVSKAKSGEGGGFIARKRLSVARPYPFLDIGFVRYDWLRSKPKQGKFGREILDTSRS